MDRANLMHIREAIASGNITPEEVVERLSAAIEAEYNKPDPDVDFINACENLLWELGTHGQQPFVSATERYLAAIAEQPRPSRAPRWIAAAAAVLVLCLGVGGFQYTWFTQTSSEDQQQYVIQGHEVTVEMISAAIAENQIDSSFQTTDWREFVDFLGFAPSIPNADAFGMTAKQYSVLIERSMISSHVLFKNESNTQSVLYSVRYATDSTNAHILFEQDTQGITTTIENTDIYAVNNINKSTFIWMEDNTIHCLSGNIDYTAGVKIAKQLLGENSQ